MVKTKKIKNAQLLLFFIVNPLIPGGNKKVTLT